ncbi:FtsH protease activity modulator HflK [candidate division KSB1 bacterium]|nr:FtsH protease activity modulator HflK [candidate division KSB1 bacterium]
MVNMSGKVVELPRFEGRWLRWIAIGAVVAWFLLSSFYTVDADEVGVIQRFGKYVETMQPGLHMKIPFGIETVKKVKVQRVLKEEFGYRTQAPGVRSTYDQGDFSSESLMLTGDLSCALVEWIVQYRIKDPKAYLFHVRDITGTIRDLTQSAMRQVVGDHSVDEVIITNRQEISLEVRDLLQQLLDHTETGVDIVTVNLQDVNPPGPVQPAFNAVNEAKQERERIINEALEAYNKVIPQAQGEAEQLLRQAEGYSVNRVNRARGDADKFLAIWQEYSRARDVTRRRMYLETMLEVMPRVKEVYIIDDKQSNLIPLLQLRGLEKGGQP